MSTEHAITKHTPTPWNLNGNAAWWDGCKDRGHLFECRLRTGTHIPDDQNKVNAAHIVRCVNAHDALVALAESIMRTHRAHLPSEAADLYGGGCGCPQCQQARAGLALAHNGAA